MNNNIVKGKLEVGHCIDCCKEYDVLGKCHSSYRHIPKSQCPFCSMKEKEDVEVPCFDDKGNVIGKSIISYKNNQITTTLFEKFYEREGNVSIGFEGEKLE